MKLFFTEDIPYVSQMGNIMNEKTKLGLYLLFPPFLLWFLIIFFFFDETLANYIFQQVNSQTVGVLMIIAGLVFPGTALFTSANCLAKKEDFKINLTVVIMSTFLMIMLLGLILLN